MAEEKKDSMTSPAGRAAGSGSDTVSAAKISAGTSVGNVGESPMPHAASGSASPGSGASQASTSSAAGQAGTGSSASGSSSASQGMGSSAGSSGPGSSGMGSSGTGSSGTAHSAQSSTLASHTSKPLGGGATPPQPNLGPEHQRHIAQPQSRDMHASGGQQGSTHQGGEGHSGGQGMADQAWQAAQSATDSAKHAAEQASGYARDTYERASDWASDTYSGASRYASRAQDRSRRAFGSATRNVQSYAAQNPVMVGLVGLAAGLLIGALLPRTRREDETFGEWADEVRAQGLRYAHEMSQRGRDYMESSFEGEDPRFSRYEGEFRPGHGPQAH